MTYHFDIDPQPAPRLVRSDKWKKRPVAVRYFKYKESLQWLAKAHSFKIPEELEVTFHIPVPQSWTPKKKLELTGKPHKQTPDLDNLLKALQDSLLGNDSHIWKYRNVQKLWAERGSIEITVIEQNL